MFRVSNGSCKECCSAGIKERISFDSVSIHVWNCEPLARHFHFTFCFRATRGSRKPIMHNHYVVALRVAPACVKETNLCWQKTRVYDKSCCTREYSEMTAERRKGTQISCTHFPSGLFTNLYRTDLEISLLSNKVGNVYCLDNTKKIRKVFSTLHHGWLPQQGNKGRNKCSNGIKGNSGI